MDNFNGQNNGNNPVSNDVQNSSGQTMDGMSGQMNNFDQPQDNMQNQSGGFGQPQDNMQNQFGGFGQPQDNMQNQFGGFNQPQDNMQNQFGGFGQPQDNMQNQFGGFGQPQDNMQNQFGGFGQPQDNMNQFGGANQGFGGFTGTPGTPVKPPKKPLSKGAKIGLFSGLIAFVALVVCAVIFLPKIIKSPKDIVVDAFGNTFEAGNEAELAKKAAEEGCTTNISISAGEGLANYNLNGYEISVKTSNDVANKTIGGKFAVNYNSEELLSLDCVINPSNIYMTSSQLIDGYIVLPGLENLDELKDFCKNMGVGDDVVQLIDELQQYDFSDSTNAADQELVKEIEDATDKFWDAVKVDKKGKKGITVNGQSVTAKEYEVIFKKDDIVAYLQTITDVGIKESGEAEALKAQGLDVETVKSLYAMLIQSDIKAKVYVLDGKVAKIEANDTMNLMGASIGYNFNLEINKDMSFLVEIAAEGQTFGVSGDIKDYQNNANGSIKAYAVGETIEIGIKSEGTEKVVLDLIYNGTTYGSMALEQIFGAPEKVDIDTSKKTYEVTKMGTDELMSILTDNQEKIMNWSNNISQKGGPLFESILGRMNGISGTDKSKTDDKEAGNTEDKKDDTEKDNDTDDKKDSTSLEFDEDDMVLVSGDTNVRILGCLDGYTLSYACEYFVDFLSDGRNLEYEIVSDMSAEDYLKSVTLSSDLFGDPVNDEYLSDKIDGQDVSIRKIDYKSDPYNHHEIYAVRKIKDNVLLVVHTYDADGKITQADAVNALSDKYFKVEK